MKKIGRNTTAHKNFKRAVENRFKKSKEILTKTETLTMPLVTLIYYLQTRNECLEKTLEEIMRNTPGKFNHNNFTLKDLQDMSIKPKTHPTLKKTHVKRTLKKLQITKRRRAVNRTDLHILKEKMKATSSIQIKKKMFAGEWREIQFKDIIDNQISKQRDFTLTQIARLASKTTNQNIIIEGINATFTSTVNNKDIENILYEISIGETDEDKEKNRKKAKKYAHKSIGKNIIRTRLPLQLMIVQKCVASYARPCWEKNNFLPLGKEEWLNMKMSTKTFTKSPTKIEICFSQPTRC
jgi:hypothetical protein